MHCDRVGELKMRVNFASCMRGISLVLLMAAVASLAACDDKDKKPGQALVRVNGDEITVHQLNDELSHVSTLDKSGKPADGERKQVLEALVDRQLLVGEAMHDKLDRDPSILLAIERAKSQILAQAYLQSKMATVTKPFKADIDAYFQAHPEFFAQRKTYDMRQLVIAASDFSKDLNAMMDKAKSLDEVAAWLDTHKIDYTKSQSTRTSSELPPQILSKMQGTDPTQLFIVRDANKSLLMSVAFLKDSPVSLDAATPEIAQYLTNKKNQEAAEAELKRLRAIAKLEYLNQESPGTTSEKVAANNGATANGNAQIKTDAGAPALK
jgi:peptidyl-prolyl cis-trans isomerase C